MDINDIVSGTGIVRKHIVPVYNRPIERATAGWIKRQRKMEIWLEEALIEGAVIDEVALMFTDKEKLLSFIAAAVQEPGVKLFNYATDQVKTSPVLSEYVVSYYFLEVEDLGMRVEVMYIDWGNSPLHSTLESWSFNPTIETDEVDQPVVVHFSFKVPKNQYLETCAAMAVAGAVGVQFCESTYGKFSYFRIDEFGQNVYLKPRANMRDAEPATPPPNTTDRGEFGMPGMGRAGRGAL